MRSATQSTQFDTLTPTQVRVLESLVAGRSVTAAAKEAGIHRTTIHLWTRTLPDFARALLNLRQQRADRLLDELDLHRPRNQHFSTDPHRREGPCRHPPQSCHGDRQTR